MSNVKDYYSVPNMQKIIIVFQSFLNEKYNTTDDKLGIDLRYEIFTIMKRLQSNPLHTNMNVKELNKITLQTLKDIVKKNYTSNNNNVENKLYNNVSERDQELYNKRKVVINENTNLNQNTNLKNDNTDNDSKLIMEKFNKAAFERDLEVKEAEQKQKNLEPDVLEENLNADDFQDKLNQLQSYRDDFLQKTIDQNKGIECTPDFTIIDENKVLSNENTFANQLNRSTDDYLNERNSIVLSQMKNITDIDPKQIFHQNQSILAQDKNQLIDYSSGGSSAGGASGPGGSSGSGGPSSSANQMSAPIIKRDTSKLKEVLKERYICINSTSRDWINQKNRYKYTVRFDYVSNYIDKVSVWPNNPTIPGTKSQLSTGIDNKTGFYDSSGIYRYPFDALKPLNYDKLSDTLLLPNEPIDFEEVEVLVDNSTNVQQSFKDILSFEITKVIVPMDIQGSTPGRLFNFNMVHPYVLLRIDEFNDNYDGTDDNIRRCFCQLVYESKYESSNGRGFYVLKPVQNEKKVFYPSLLASLSKLTFSLLEPTGTLINDSIDGYSIQQVAYETFNRYYVKIITNRYYDKNEFSLGDKVLIKQYNAYKINTTQDASALQSFNNYINREIGHQIVKIGDLNDNSYYRSFYIQAPGAFDPYRGVYNIEMTQIESLVTFNCAYDIGLNADNGYILNLSLQNSISCKLVTKTLEPIDPL